MEKQQKVYITEILDVELQKSIKPLILFGEWHLLVNFHSILVSQKKRGGEEGENVVAVLILI